MYCHINTSRSLCAVPNMAVFCSSLISCFSGMLLRCCLRDSELFPVAPVITRITFAFAFHVGWISIMRYLNFKIVSAYFFIIFLSPRVATSIKMHVHCLFWRIIMSGLLLRIILPVRTCWFHNMITLPSVSTDFGKVHNSDYYYYYYHHHQISHFSALAGKYSPVLGCSNQQD